MHARYAKLWCAHARSPFLSFLLLIAVLTSAFPLVLLRFQLRLRVQNCFAFPQVSGGVFYALSARSHVLTATYCGVEGVATAVAGVCGVHQRIRWEVHGEREDGDDARRMGGRVSLCGATRRKREVHDTT